MSSEISKYRELGKIKSTADPLAFWKDSESNLPYLSRFAKSYLVVQGSSVSSERVFSTAGDIVTAERNLLDPENVNMLIFLRKNSVIL